MSVFQQFAPELSRNQDGADFALQGDLRLAPLDGLHGEIPHLTDADACGADGLHQQGQPLPPQGVGGSDQAVVLGTGQLPTVIPK